MKHIFLISIFIFFNFALSNETFDEKDINLQQNEYIDDIISDLKSTIMQKGLKYLTQEKSIKKEISTKELVIDLKNPKFSHGILVTHEGGVIKNADIRIQAKTIQYIKREENGVLIHKIEAEGDLMMLYKDRVFVGDELEYDFVNKTGKIYSGRTFTSPWYLRGDLINLYPNGSYKIENVSLTTCENANSAWDIHASKVNVEKKDLLKAKKIRFRLFKFPTIWLPSFKVNLKKFFSKPIIKYKLNWDWGSGPRASIRYQAYSWRDLAAFLRLDYRTPAKFGGAIETEYYPKHKRTTFETRSYVGYDYLLKEPKNELRYRFQGAYRGHSQDKKTYGFITWDKYSDIKMPSDFKSDDFEVATAKKTELKLRHKNENNIFIVHSRARVNNFETIKQDLPTFYTNFHPIVFNKTNIIMNNWINLSYLDYVFSKSIDKSKRIKDFESMRIEGRSEIYKPLKLKGLTFNPKAGIVFIGYSNSPSKKAKSLLSVSYGGKLLTSFYKNYSNYRHISEPYLEYTGFTDPNVHTDDHYIFSIEDGFDRYNLIKTGVYNQFFSTKKNISLSVDTYVNMFLGLSEIKTLIPKGYLDLKLFLPTIYIKSNFAWNMEHKLLDYSNVRFGITLSKDAAFAVEFRYRSKYDFRKSDRENFVLNSIRNENELLKTPLSDERCTFLTHLFFRLTPFISINFESHHGWKRKYQLTKTENNQKVQYYIKSPYNEFKIGLNAMVSRSWKIQVSYNYTAENGRFSFDYFLTKF